MARLTIEDCVRQVPNRFDLIRLTTLRAKQLRRGARALVPTTNGEIVTALREAAAGFVRPCEEQPAAREATPQPVRGTRSGGERRRAPSQSQSRRARPVFVSSVDPSPLEIGTLRHASEPDVGLDEEDLLEEDVNLDVDEFLDEEELF